MSIQPTPKFKSAVFKALLQSLKGIFDTHSLGVILLDALERRAAEQIFTRFNRGQFGVQVRSLKKADLADQITTGFFAHDEVAYQTIKEMDRATSKERHIVDSIPTQEAPQRVGSYRAIALKRERAKFVWALARDERPEVRQLANKVINDYFAEAADVETSARVLSGEESGFAVDAAELAKRLKDQAERLSEAASTLSDHKDQITELETERANLMVKLGARERQLRSEAQAREAAQAQLQAREAAQAASDAQAEALEKALNDKAEADLKVEELNRRVRRLEKLAGASKNLSEAQETIEGLGREIDSLKRQLQAEQAAKSSLEASKEATIAKLSAEISDTRDALHQTRQRVVELEATLSEQPVEAAERFGVAVLLDQANLAANAHTAYHRKVDFSRILDLATHGRRLRRAVAFVVDNGGTNFGAFTDKLREAGWELRIKRPKRFADGSQKADWDMAIAMEALHLAREVQTVVLGSGDGDFAPLAQRLRSMNVEVEALAFPIGLARELIDAVNKVHRLDASVLENDPVGH